MVAHLDGKVMGDYVRETSAAAAGFLVPTGELATQGADTFEVASPPPVDPTVIRQGPAITSVTEWARQHWWVGPIVTGTAPHGARVELLVTGDPGRQLYLGFEETGGLVDGGRSSLGVSKGAAGQRVMRSPAVMFVPALQASPNTSCAVSGVATTRGRNHMHIILIDY